MSRNTPSDAKKSFRVSEFSLEGAALNFRNEDDEDKSCQMEYQCIPLTQCSSPTLGRSLLIEQNIRHSNPLATCM